jgi:hypothetical protein
MKNRIFLALAVIFIFSPIYANQNSQKILSVAAILRSSLDLSSVNGEAVPSCANGLFGTSVPVRFKMEFSCFPTNLRQVENPLAFGSNIRFTLRMSPDAGGQELKFEIPYNIVIPDYNGSPPGNPEQPANVQILNGTYSDLSREKNVISFKINNIRLKPLDSGEVDRNSAAALLERIEAEQFVPASLPVGYPHTGYNGILTTEISKDFSSDQCVYNIAVKVPGAARPGQGPWYLTREKSGFCGGWYSPLMIFEDDRRPRFSGVTDFQLADYPTRTYWVEPGAPGSFLALDKNQNGIIDNGGELFGDNEGASHGFEALAKFDTNKDGIIDSKDPIFLKLLLWQDKNGDGKSSSDELFNLKKFGVISFNLKYKNAIQHFGDRASYKQASTYKYKKNGKIKTGHLLDIWFANYETSRVARRENINPKKAFPQTVEKLSDKIRREGEAL